MRRFLIIVGAIALALAWTEGAAACVPVKGPPSPEQATPACKPVLFARRPRRAAWQNISPITVKPPAGIDYGYRPGPAPTPNAVLPSLPQPLQCGAAGCLDPYGLPYQNPAANVLLDSKGRTCTKQGGLVQCF
jgi:hypothetical protein